MQTHDDSRALLARIDERTKNTEEKLDELSRRLDKKCVTRAEFWPVKTICYGGAGIVLTAVFGALVTLVVRH